MDHFPIAKYNISKFSELFQFFNIWLGLNKSIENMGIGIILAVGSLWLFVRRWRATMLIAAAIPISLLATFVVLNIFGRTINVISLAGLAFGIWLARGIWS